MKILVWQWGRYGAGPRTAVDFASAFDALADTQAALSLSREAEIMRGAAPPICALPVSTYKNAGGYLRRAASAGPMIRSLTEGLRRLAPDLALCAMPGPLDLAMAAALRASGIPFAVTVHDADAHPGDGYPFQMALQRALVRRAGAVVALSTHVATRIADQGLLNGRPLIRSVLPQPPISGLPPVRAHGGPFRLLSFGRLLPYKGLDLLAGALALLPPSGQTETRIVGQGPETRDLAALRRLPGVTVENRWVPDDEIPALLGWADAVVLSHREASQSGVAAAALAARRFLVSTRVGGIAEQAQGDSAAFLSDVSAPGLASAIMAAREAPAPGPGPALLTAAAELRDSLGDTLLRPAQSRSQA